MRLFLALELGSRERRAICQAIAPMKKAAPEASWVREENLHLSIKFFGEQPDTAPAELEKILAGIAAAQPPLELRISGLGAFPNLRAPRVVWMGVQHDPRLELMHHDVEATCAAHGFALDARAFRPHITIARVREEMPLANARALAIAARAVGYKGVQQVTELSLLESTLTPAGSRYTRVASIPLGGA
ncbi:MAG: RNA 2',3'-cyclic phosphodiesterase [Gemmatimonadaceae bacterium]|nr:RNA 2',3'-cyclic phosphodiesterase [Gemmatimonadaceae bacterium]